jgi:hypothetical protein
MQLGPDGKIYVARSFGASHLGVIDSPDLPGSSCNYSDFGLDIDPGFMGINSGLTLTGFMQSYLRNGISCGTTTGISENSGVEISVAPNPSSAGFVVQLKAMSTLSLYDATGKCVFSLTTNDRVDFGQDLPAGIYFFTAVTENGIYSSPLIKQ